MKHTKGPWELISDQDYPTIDQIWSTDEFPTYIARTCYAHKPNAQLIACAPEMLELLQVVLLSPAYEEAKNDYGWLEDHWTNQIPLLINKATGGK